MGTVIVALMRHQQPTSETDRNDIGEGGWLRARLTGEAIAAELGLKADLVISSVRQRAIDSGVAAAYGGHGSYSAFHVHTDDELGDAKSGSFPLTDDDATYIADQAKKQDCTREHVMLTDRRFYDVMKGRGQKGAEAIGAILDKHDDVKVAFVPGHSPCLESVTAAWMGIPNIIFPFALDPGDFILIRLERGYDSGEGPGGWSLVGQPQYFNVRNHEEGLRKGVVISEVVPD